MTTEVINIDATVEYDTNVSAVVTYTQVIVASVTYGGGSGGGDFDGILNPPVDPGDTTPGDTGTGGGDTDPTVPGGNSLLMDDGCWLQDTDGGYLYDVT